MDDLEECFKDLMLIYFTEMQFVREFIDPFGQIIRDGCVTIICQNEEVNLGREILFGPPLLRRARILRTNINILERLNRFRHGFIIEHFGLRFHINVLRSFGNEFAVD